MSKEHRFEFNNTVVVIEEPYKDDSGCVMFGEKIKNENINVFLKTYRQSFVEFFIELQKYITDLESKLSESEKRLKDIDNWKENYGYSNYEDAYMLEDLQSRAFQSEDDTKVVNDLLDYLNISDETEILSTLKQQLAEKDQAIEGLQEINKSLGQTCNNDSKEIERLREQLAEERKRVVQEIRNELDNMSGEHKLKTKGGIGIFTCVPRQTLEEFLDQIERGE